MRTDPTAAAEEPRPFTPADVADRELVIRMLRFEDGVMLGPIGKAIFADTTLPHLTSLDTYYVFHRITLAQHGFTTTDADVLTYRTIFGTYYSGPHEFDAEVLNSVCYMRQNKCVFYDAPLIGVGDAVPDADLLTLAGAPTTLHGLLAEHPHEFVFVGAFSNS